MAYLMASLLACFQDQPQDQPTVRHRRDDLRDNATKIKALDKHYVSPSLR